MEDKEIIIDGVDVAGCVRLQDDKISCDLGGECKGWESCYYKQLKRLEQENTELIEDNLNLSKENKVNLSRSFDLNRELQNLSDENAELKVENEMLEKEINKIRENKCTDCIQHLITKSHKLALEKVNKVFGTLREIKEITDEMYEVYRKLPDDNISESLEQILDLIYKVESEV